MVCSAEIYLQLDLTLIVHFLGFALKKDQIYELHPGDILEILWGKYLYEIIFDTGTSTSRSSESNIVSSAVTSVPETSMNGVWENVDQGKMLIFTPNNVKVSNKVFKCFLVT